MPKVVSCLIDVPFPGPLMPLAVKVLSASFLFLQFSSLRLDLGTAVVKEQCKDAPSRTAACSDSYQRPHLVDL